MYEINSHSYNFNDGNGLNNTNSNQIYTSSSTIGEQYKKNMDTNSNINLIEEFKLTPSVNSNATNTCFKTDDSYSHSKLQRIMDNEHRRGDRGKKLDLRYDDEDDLINDLEKLNETYDKFEGFEYYNQMVYDDAYGSSNLKDSGCCPTCMAMILTYLTGDEIIPPDLIDTMEKYYYKNSGTDVSGNCLPNLCEDYGIDAYRLDWSDEDEVREALENGNPILLNVGPGDFTSGTHFIVLLGFDDDGNVIVADPNSVYNSTQTYPLEDLLDQVFKTGSACWCFERQ